MTTTTDTTLTRSVERHYGVDWCIVRGEHGALAVKVHDALGSYIEAWTHQHATTEADTFCCEVLPGACVSERLTRRATDPLREAWDRGGQDALFQAMEAAYERVMR
jgi:hypothetical protein